MKALDRVQQRRPERGVKLAAWKIGVAVLGAVLLAAGVVMMVLPGPGLLFVVLGLAVLATEYAWAQVLHNKAKNTASAAANKVRRKK